MSIDSIAFRAEVPRNRLLARLRADTWARLSPQLELVSLSLREVIYDVDCPIEHVYFPEDGMVSVVSPTLKGTAVETGTVGHEGLVGLAVVLGADRSSSQAFCQIPGRGYRIAADTLRDALRSNPEVMQVFCRYAQAFLIQTSQGSACNRLHTMRQRCARWLLETHDRVRGDSFVLTQEFFAQMLGVRRATVSEVAAQLQRDGIIHYEYRRITILDRDKLEAAACECYGIIHREFERLIEGRRVPSMFAGQRTAAGGATLLDAPSEAATDLTEAT